MLNLRLDLGIPEAYVADVQQRMSFYKRLAEARRADEHEALAREIEDRNGPLPEPVRDLVRYAVLRVKAEDIGVTQVDRTGDILTLRFAEDAVSRPRTWWASWVVRRALRSAPTRPYAFRPAVIRSVLSTSPWQPSPRRP